MIQGVHCHIPGGKTSQESLQEMCPTGSRGGPVPLSFLRPPSLQTPGLGLGCSVPSSGHLLSRDGGGLHGKAWPRPDPGSGEQAASPQCGGHLRGAQHRSTNGWEAALYLGLVCTRPLPEKAHPGKLEPASPSFPRAHASTFLGQKIKYQQAVFL